jgi:hypothetical protein
LVYKGMNHYNEWEFVYSPIQERNSATGIVGGSGGSASGNGISGAGNNNTSGGTASGNGISGTGDDGNWAGGLLGGTGR